MVPALTHSCSLDSKVLHRQGEREKQELKSINGKGGIKEEDKRQKMQKTYE